MEKGCFIMLDTFLMTLSAVLWLVKHQLSHCYHSVTLAQPHLIISCIRMESYRRNSALCYRDSSICVCRNMVRIFFFFNFFPPLLISIPTWVYNTVCFSVFLLMDIWAFSSFCLAFWETALLNFTSWKCTDAYLAVFPPGQPELFPCCSEEVGWF